MTITKSGVIIHTYAEKSAMLFNIVEHKFLPRWWNGRHKRLKISRFWRAGSSPARGTIIFHSNMHRIRFGILNRFYLFDKNAIHVDPQELDYGFLPVDSMRVFPNV